MASLLCEKVDGGNVHVQKNDMSELLVRDSVKISKAMIENRKRPKSSPLKESDNEEYDLNNRVDSGSLVQHSRKLEAWLSDKGVKQVQRLEHQLMMKLTTGDGDCGRVYAFPTNYWEKTDAQARQMKKKYTKLLDTEETFVKQLDAYVKQKESVFDKRKRDILHKRWTDAVYEPLRQEIINEMDGPNYTQLDQRKRELYREYLEFTNKKGHVFLDTYPPDEYYATGLHATRPILFKGLQAETKPLCDPLLSQHQQCLDEDRTILRCTSGITYNNKDIETIRLPPLPLVPLGRHGTNNATWIQMALTNIESPTRKQSRKQLTRDYNKVHFRLNEWAQVPSPLMAKVFDEELKISRKKRFGQAHESINQLSHKSFAPDDEPALITNINQPIPVSGPPLTALTV